MADDTMLLTSDPIPDRGTRANGTSREFGTKMAVGAPFSKETPTLPATGSAARPPLDPPGLGALRL